MLYDFVKLQVTKQLKDIYKIKCIVISQELIDYSTVYLLVNKKIKYVVNCVDRIYDTSALKILRERNIRIFYLKKNIFNLIQKYGNVYIGSNCIIFNGASYCFHTPEIAALDNTLDAFIENTIGYMNDEFDKIKDVYLEGDCGESKECALIISRGYHLKSDVANVKKIIRKYKPVIIAVDGGADIAAAYGIIPDIIIGDMDSVSKSMIEKCSRVIIHCYMDGKCPGKRAISKVLNKDPGYIYCIGTSEDAAIQYCIYKGVEKIYTLGFHTTSCNFIEKGRCGMSSYVLLRMYYGDRIVDIKNSMSENRVGYIPVTAVIMLLIYISIMFTLSVGVLK